MQEFAARLGIHIPDNPDLPAAGIAAAIALLIWAGALLLERMAGPRLAAWWQRRAGGHGAGLTTRMGALLRWASASILLLIALKAQSWPLVAALILGLSLAVAAAGLVRSICRALGLPVWGAWLLAATAFAAALGEALGGMGQVTQLLDSVAVEIGSKRLSLLNVVQLALTLLVLLAAVRLITRIANHSISHSSGLDATQKLLAQKLIGLGIIVAAFFIGIDLAGIDLTALAVFSGAFGLAIGFGLQKTFGNLIAGIILLMDRSIKPGDVIAVGDSFGSVSKIGVRAVSIITREAKEHLIPNEIMMTEEVVNWSYSSRNVRVTIPVGVSYDSDIQLAQKLMADAARETGRVLNEPSPKVWLTKFGDNAVEHEIRLWISDPEDGVASIRSEVLNRLWVLFRDNDVSLPFQQHDVRIKEWPGAPPLPEDKAKPRSA